MPQRESPLYLLAGLQAGRSEFLVLAGFALCVVGSAMAIGAVHPIVQIILACTVAGLWLLLVLSPKVPLLVPFPSWVFFGLALWSLLQRVPLPLPLAERLIPDQVDNWRRAFYPFGIPAEASVCISFDRVGPLFEGLKWAVYATLFALGASLGHIFGKRLGVIVVLLSGGLLALTTLIHGLLHAETLYGFYPSPYIQGRWGAAPLINPNNLAGYLNLSAFCGIALIVSRRMSSQIVSVAVLTGLTLGVSVLTASRGGALTLAVGLVGVLAMWKLQPRTERNPDRVALWLPGLAIVGGALLATLGAQPETRKELLQFGVDKFQIFEWAVPLIAKHPWFGIGRGSFETVFPRFQRSLGSHIYAHAENFVVQWICEWGLIVAAAAVITCALMARSLLRVSRRDLAIKTALLGVGVILAQNLVDVALEVPAVVIAICAVCAPIFGQLSQPKESHRSRYLTSLPHLALLGLAVALVIPSSSEPAWASRERMHKAYSDLKEGTLTASAFRLQLLTVTRMHPAEPYFPLLGGLVAMSRHQSPMPWLNVALEKDPMNSRPHLLAAQYLARRGRRAQSMLELRLAASLEKDALGPLAQQLAALKPTLEEALSLAPPGPRGAQLLAFLASVSSIANSDLAIRLIENAIRLAPTEPTYRLRLAGQVLDTVRAQTPNSLCPVPQAPSCLKQAKQALQKAKELGATSETTISLDADLLGMEKGPSAAEEFLALRCQDQPNPAPCLLQRLNFALQIKDSVKTEPAIDAYLAFTCVADADCASAHEWLGGVYAGRGIWLVAMGHLAQAVRLGPTDTRWLAFARVAQLAGQNTRAAAALDELAWDRLTPTQLKEAQGLRDTLRTAPVGSER